MILSICLSPALQRSLFFNSLNWQCVNRANEVIYGVGGKGVNVARVIRQLEGHVTLILPIGGHIGNRVLEILNQENITHHAILLTSQQTRICSTLLDLKNQTHTEIVEESPNADCETVRDILNIYKEIVHKFDCVVLSGSVPPGFPDTIFQSMTDFAKECAVPVILDTVGSPLHKTLSSNPWLVKPNKLELETYLNTKLDSQEYLKKAMKHIQLSGAQNVLVTWEGPEAMLLYEDKFYFFRNPELHVVNSIGSGDALAAGIGFSWIKSKDFLKAVQFGMACAGANVLTSLAGQVKAEDVKKIYPQVTFECL